MSELLDNPTSVIWSHSNRQSDFFELPTDGAEMHEALGWLLQHYKGVKLWMGIETEEGAELYLTCSPSSREAVINKLQVFDDEQSLFEAVADSPLDTRSESAAVGE